MLPRMTWGNWLFWGIMVFIGIIFIWLALFEKLIPLWVGLVIALAGFSAVIVYGPRLKEDHEELEE